MYTIHGYYIIHNTRLAAITAITAITVAVLRSDHGPGTCVRLPPRRRSVLTFWPDLSENCAGRWKDVRMVSDGVNAQNKMESNVESQGVSGSHIEQHDGIQLELGLISLVSLVSHVVTCCDLGNGLTEKKWSGLRCTSHNLIQNSMERWHATALHGIPWKSLEVSGSLWKQHLPSLVSLVSATLLQLRLCQSVSIDQFRLVHFNSCQDTLAVE